MCPGLPGPLYVNDSEAKQGCFLLGGIRALSRDCEPIVGPISTGGSASVNRVNAVLTAKWAAEGVGGSESPAADGAGDQLAFPIPAARLTEDVGLSGVHAVPWMPRTRGLLGFEEWPIRAFCGVRVKDTAGGTVDPAAIRCRPCLRAMRKAGLL